MKAVLISIQPKWCELIASGKKTVEVRKTKPKLETPFKVYIYCTKNKNNLFFPPIKPPILRRPNYVEDVRGNGKVIGEFVCDCIEPFTTDYRRDGLQTDRIVEASCVDYFELCDYEVNSCCLYAWHISDLVIYDKPKELSEFKRECKNAYNFSLRHCVGCDWYYSESNESINFFDDCACDCFPPMKRPPQSWCYVERSDNNAE